MANAYIGLGSNLDDPYQQVVTAIEELAQHRHLQLLAQSHLYRSAPIGPEQPDYINACVLINTDLAPLQLLDELQSLENLHGRVREQRWGARTLDLDLLLYDEISMQHPRLSIPHPRIDERRFVIQPLLDINPALSLGDGKSLQQLLANCPRQGMVRI